MQNLCWSLARVFCVIAAITGAASPAWAGGLSVSPVLVNMGAGQHSTAITLSNGGDQPQRIQAEVFRWTRVDGEDVLKADSQTLLNPPLFEMAPGGSQIVRLGFRRGALPPPDRESAYRVFFQEVPRTGAEPGAGTVTRLQMVLRIGVPMFMAPAAPRPALEWSASAKAGKLKLQLDNRGNIHVRVSKLRVSHPPAGAEQAVEGFFYVFPGETQVWTLAAGTAGARGPLLLDALTDNGSVHVELPIKTD